MQVWLIKFVHSFKVIVAPHENVFCCFVQEIERRRELLRQKVRVVKKEEVNDLVFSLLASFYVLFTSL